MTTIVSGHGNPCRSSSCHGSSADVHGDACLRVLPSTLHFTPFALPFHIPLIIYGKALDQLPQIFFLYYLMLPRTVLSSTTSKTYIFCVYPCTMHIIFYYAVFPLDYKHHLLGLFSFPLNPECTIDDKSRIVKIISE